jgi:hypothetical protein
MKDDAAASRVLNRTTTALLEDRWGALWTAMRSIARIISLVSEYGRETAAARC